MRRSHALSWAVGALFLVAAAPAAAQEPVVKSHKGQLGVHAQPGTGFRVLFPYNEEFCGKTDNAGAPKKVCSGRSPFFIDLGLSYGVSHSVELLFELRFGLERDFSGVGNDGPRQFAMSPGVKVFVDETGTGKFFSTVQLTIDTTDFSAVGGSDTKTDFGLRNTNGFQFDFSENAGVYLFFGATIGFVRWLRFEGDGGIGIQGRFP